jgi:HAD superfamily hydrolase (TIGR01662 family)
MIPAQFQWVVFDWGNTLMYEEGPQDLPMALWPEVKIVPGAKETLYELSKNHKIAIATNATVSNRGMIHRALDRVSLCPYISEIFCLREMGVRKDTSEFWEIVMQKLNIAIHDIVMVGDSIEQDIIVPRRMGIYAVWFNENQKQIGPAEDIPTVHRLTDLIRLISSSSV